MKNLVIIGVSSTAEHVYHFVQEYNLYNVIGFAVNEQYKKQDRFLGKPLYVIENLGNIVDKSSDLLFVAMLWNRLNADRRRVYENLKNQGYSFANLISPTAKIRGELLGDNCWFHDYTIVQHDAKVGADVAVMAYSLIGAHAVLGAHCFLGAKSTIGGNCRVGEQCFIGINSTVFDDRIVGNKCIIGAGTPVNRDVPDFTRCSISMESISRKSYPEEEMENKLLFSKNQH